MSRRKKKENWGGDSDEDDQTSIPTPGAGGMSSLLGRGKPSKKVAMAAAAGGGGGADGKGASSDEEDSGQDSGAEAEEGSAEATGNTRERKKETGGRDHELVYTARMKQQGIRMDEEDEEDAAAANASGDDEKEETVSSARKKAAAGAGGDEAMEDAAPEMSQYAKMKALFDKKKDDKYMTFDADDPLKPNPNKKRAAEREDEELAEDGDKDPWLLQARDDSARAAEQAADPAAHFNTHPAHKSKAPLVASTAVFEGDEAAPVFNQAQARLVLLKHMQPGETVLKAVKRLGAPAASGAKGGAAAAPVHAVKNKMKNVRSKPKEDAAAAAPVVAVDPAAEKARKAAFEELTEAAQGFLSSGYVEIYQDAYEKIDRIVQAQRAHEAQVAQRKAAAAAGAQAASAPSAGADARARAAARLQRKRDARAAGLPEPESSDEDDDEGDNARARPAAAAAAASSLTSSAAAAAASSSSFSAASAASPAASGDVQWVYKYSGDDKELQGPFSSEKMAEWKAAGFLDSSVVIQRFGPGQSLVTAAAVPASNRQVWLSMSQVDFAQPLLTQPLPVAPANAQPGGPPKKKFKF